MDESDSFFPMTAFDESGIVGHLIMRFTDENKNELRFGFIIVDDKKEEWDMEKKCFNYLLSMLSEF